MLKPGEIKCNCKEFKKGNFCKHLPSSTARVYWDKPKIFDEFDNFKPIPKEFTKNLKKLQLTQKGFIQIITRVSSIPATDWFYNWWKANRTKR